MSSVQINGDTSGSITLQSPAVAGSTVLDLPAASGTVALTSQTGGFKNKIINGEVTRINQRGVANWAAVANGSYGYDRWKKVDASNMTQIIEAGNFKVSTVHTLSGTGVTTQQITSPASGNWTLPNIPITATNIQLEEGSVATPFETRPIGTELALCQRYYQVCGGGTSGSALYASGYGGTADYFGGSWLFPVTMRGIPSPVVKNGTWSVSNCGQPGIVADQTGFNLSAQITSGPGTGNFYPNSADDTCTFSAEL